MTTAREVESAVARVLARQRRRRRLFAAIVIAVLILALLAIRCGGGFGLGAGDGRGRGGGGPGAGTAIASPRCQLRVDASGVTVDGKPATSAAAVVACRGGADVVVTGDARQGTWDQLALALRAAGVPVAVRGAGAPVAVDAGP